MKNRPRPLPGARNAWLIILFPLLAIVSVGAVMAEPSPPEKKEAAAPFELRIRWGDVDDSAERSKKDTSLWLTVITAVAGAIGAIVLYQFQSYVKARDAQVKEWQRVRARYLSPLVASIIEYQVWIEFILSEKLVSPKLQEQAERAATIAATADGSDAKLARERARALAEQVQRTQQATQTLVAWFQSVKDIAEGKQSQDGFASHCNGVLYFSVTTLYVTAVYFAVAARIRSSQPFIQTGAFNDSMLLEKIAAVRNAFSGEDGLWDTLQDSIGSVVTHPDGRIFSYREFCFALIDKDIHPWFLNLMDFYRGIARRYEKLETINRYLEELKVYVQPICSHRIQFFGGDWIHG